MVKGIVTNRSAAGLRRSAIAERLRLREEWSSLKGTDDENELPTKVKKKQTKAFIKNLHNTKELTKIPSRNMTKTFSKRDKENSQPRSPNNTLRGVVALVDVGAENRALALRAALTALGATVVSAWSPLITHLIWSQTGSREVRARARALACRVVSPLWVEACAAAARRVSEKVFPSTARDSDLPSPSTLCSLLKRAEKENWPVTELLSDSEEDARPVRLRISSDTDDTTDKTGGTTRGSVDIETRVNTAPRRALPVSISPPPANPKSKRKLFTARPDGEEDSDAENTPVPVTKTKICTEKPSKRPGKGLNRADKASTQAPERQRKVKKYITQEQKRNLENAERMARRLADPNRRVEHTQTQRRKTSNVPRIVLSGMPKSQYNAVVAAIQTLKGKVQSHVNHRTTHVLLGCCREDSRHNNEKQKQNKPTARGTSANKTPVKPFSICNQCNSPEGLVMRMFEYDNVEVTDHCSNPSNAQNKDVTIICSTVNKSNVNSDVNNHNVSDVCEGVTNDKRLRTLKTLIGAARGCRVLHAQWALDSLKEQKWIPHIGYEVTHLLKIVQKARIERSAIGKMRVEYGYNVFRGMRVSVRETADQRDAAVQLLTLCGAEIVNEADVERNNQNPASVPNVDKTTQNGGYTQNGAESDNDCDIVVVGKADGEVSSKWVFDSVAAGRPRTTRRYINKNIITLQD